MTTQHNNPRPTPQPICALCLKRPGSAMMVNTLICDVCYEQAKVDLAWVYRTSLNLIREGYTR